MFIHFEVGLKYGKNYIYKSNVGTFKKGFRLFSTFTQCIFCW